VEQAQALLGEAAALAPALLELDESSPAWLKLQKRAGIG
jgi:hypothetical protein